LYCVPIVCQYVQTVSFQESATNAGTIASDGYRDWRIADRHYPPPS